VRLPCTIDPDAGIADDDGDSQKMSILFENAVEVEKNRNNEEEGASPV
jgi:hypothetical protein